MANRVPTDSQRREIFPVAADSQSSREVANGSTYRRSVFRRSLAIQGRRAMTHSQAPDTADSLSAVSSCCGPIPCNSRRAFCLSESRTATCAAFEQLKAGCQRDPRAPLSTQRLSTGTNGRSVGPV